MLIQHEKTQLLYLYWRETVLFSQYKSNIPKIFLSIFTTPTFPHPTALHGITLFVSMYDVADQVPCNSRCSICHDGCHWKIFLTCFCCPVSSPTLSCLIYTNWPSNLGLSSLSSDVFICCLGEQSSWEHNYSTQYLTGL